MNILSVTPELQAGALLVLRRRQAMPRAVRAEVSRRFGHWLPLARPEYRWDAIHFQYMQERLDQATAGSLRRILFNVAIRHGKTEHNTISYGAYRLERDPRFRWLVGSYNQQQADKLSREIRRLAKARGVLMSDERDAAREWETSLGGGVRAVGTGTGLASVNADGILLDDPIGSRDEAESQAHRDRVWDWITNDVLARCEPHTIVLLTMSRWHKDDPAGRILDRQRERWTLVDLPGRAEPDDPLGRPEGAPLWPAQRNEVWLQEKREELGEYGFASLVQGRPRPREGGMFKWAWWQLLDELPKTGRGVRYWDLAGTTHKHKGHDPDYTAGVLDFRLPDGRSVIADVERFRKSVAERDARIEEIYRLDKSAYPGRVSCWLETETGIAGQDRTAALVRRLQAIGGIAVRTEHATGKKVLRIEPLASKAEAGNLLLGPGSWRDAFRAEAADYTGLEGGPGQHDDQLDAAAGAESKLEHPTPQIGLSSWEM